MILISTLSIFHSFRAISLQSSPSYVVYILQLIRYARFCSYENDFLDKLIKEGKRKLARKFNLSYCYTDDFNSFSNKRFKEFISDIYPNKLRISETTESTSVSFFLDLLFTDVPFIACVINSPRTFTYYLNLPIFILESGLLYFRVLTICLLLSIL